MEKCFVNGENALPSYEFLRMLDDDAEISWNFAKFLVDKNGQPVKSYVPKCHPNDIIPDIEALINGFSSVWNWTNNRDPLKMRNSLSQICLDTKWTNDFEIQLNEIVDEL